MRRVLKIHPQDDLIVALTELKAGQDVELDGEYYQLREDIPAKHKFAARDFAEGESVHMYGVQVGRAMRPIAQGQLISTQNIRHATQAYQLGKRKTHWQPPDVSKWRQATFEGYHRADGRVGTANYWLVVPLVFCENRNIRIIREVMLKELGYGHDKDYLLDLGKLKALYRQGATAPEMLQADIRMTAAQA
ncbi:MAG: altronate dehydratase, partial [Bacteroidetes bacterium]